MQTIQLTNSQAFVIAMLESGPKCLKDFARFDMSRYSARIHELRNLGYTINKRTCRRHTHPFNPTIPEYVLDSDDE